MLSIRSLIYKLRHLMIRRRAAEELEDELRFHLQLETEELVARGRPAAEARQAARRKFGNVTAAIEDSRQFWGFRWLDELTSDLRYALRTFGKDRAFTLTCLTIICLGVGVTSASFSVIHAVLLRPLEYRDPERLVMLWRVNEKGNAGIEQARRTGTSLSAREILAWRDRANLFESVSGIHVESRGHLGEAIGTLPIDADPNAMPAMVGFVSEDFFRTLGVHPMLGRPFRSETNGVILQHDYWRRRFAADPGVVGRYVRHSRPAGKGPGWPVIGVMPPRFAFYTRQIDYFAPLDLHATAKRFPNARGQIAVGRLKPGISLEQAQARADAYSEHVEQELHGRNQGWRVRLVPVAADAAGEFRPAALMLFGAVGLLLLTVCANTANLQLVRAISRGREMTLRAALGASRMRLIKQQLTESLLLSAAGGLLGLGIANIIVRQLREMLPNRHTWGAFFLQADLIQMNSSVILFAIASALLIGVAFGLVPALRGSRPNLNDSLKEAGHSATSMRGRKLRNSLVIAEVTLAVVLVTGAALLLKSFLALYDHGPGFEHDSRLLVSVRPGNQYLTQTIEAGGASEDQAAQAITAGDDRYWDAKNIFHTAVLSEIRRLPGVTGVTASDRSPMEGGYWLSRFTLKPGDSGSGDAPVQAVRSAVEPNYFGELGIPLLQGRTFSAEDSALSPAVAIVSRHAAQYFWPGQNPIAKQIRPEGRSNNPWLTIVGVVGDVHEDGIEKSALAHVYQPWPQNRWWHGSAKLIISTSVSPVALLPAIRRTVEGIDTDSGITRIYKLEDLVRDSAWRLNYSTVLLGALAVLAFLLALVGVYGVLSYMIRERAREIGIRVAIGASPTAVVALVVREAFTTVLIGITLGLAAALGLTQSLRTLLFGVEPMDAETFFGAALAFITVALLASYLPAKRAAGLDPCTVLRQE